MLPKGLVSQKPAFSSPISSLIWPFLQNPTQPMSLWTRHLPTSNIRASLPIPRHLRDGHYSGSKELGNAQDYLYPHNYPGNWVKQDYLPEKFANHHYFQAEDTGKYERALAQRKEAIDRLRKSEILFKNCTFLLIFLKKWYHINIETLWCTTSHLSVDRLFCIIRETKVF